MPEKYFKAVNSFKFTKPVRKEAHHRAELLKAQDLITKTNLSEHKDGKSKEKKDQDDYKALMKNIITRPKTPTYPGIMYDKPQEILKQID